MNNRLDQILVEKGLFESRAKASAAIKAGLVRINGQPVRKTSTKVAPNCLIEAAAEHPWVSRGGLKLEFALRQFGISVTNRVCLDIGASTGGFSEVLIHQGAALVYAVDVGHNQLHPSLRRNSNIINMEKTDARTIVAEQFDRQPDLLVCDASFISATKILAAAMSLVVSGADLVTLVKPQFEVGRQNIGKGGLVKDAEKAELALLRVQDWVTAQGWIVHRTDTSPVTGGDGNTEFLLHANKV